jgi:hypothetical protein
MEKDKILATNVRKDSVGGVEFHTHTSPIVALEAALIHLINEFRSEYVYEAAKSRKNRAGWMSYGAPGCSFDLFSQWLITRGKKHGKD